MCSVYDLIVVCRIDPLLLIQKKAWSIKENKNGSINKVTKMQLQHNSKSSLGINIMIQLIIALCYVAF